MIKEGEALPAVIHGALRPPPSSSLLWNQVVRVGELELAVHHTPGHAPGHVVFHCAAERFAVVGDLIFKGSIGRTDMEYCDPAKMDASLAYVAAALPRETRLFPGHMGATDLAAELASNPFLRGLG